MCLWIPLQVRIHREGWAICSEAGLYDIVSYTFSSCCQREGKRLSSGPAFHCQACIKKIGIVHSVSCIV